MIKVNRKTRHDSLPSLSSLLFSSPSLFSLSVESFFPSFAPLVSSSASIHNSRRAIGRSDNDVVRLSDRCPALIQPISAGDNSRGATRTTCITGRHHAGISLVDRIKLHRGFASPPLSPIFSVNSKPTSDSFRHPETSQVVHMTEKYWQTTARRLRFSGTTHFSSSCYGRVVSLVWIFVVRP